VFFAFQYGHGPAESAAAGCRNKVMAVMNADNGHHQLPIGDHVDRVF
jgi:hypothetical protein